MAEYNHDQSASSATWTITHNLASNTIAVDAMVDNGGDLEKILPLNVEHTSDNVLTITFSSVQTGKARLITD